MGDVATLVFIKHPNDQNFTRINTNGPWYVKGLSISEQWDSTIFSKEYTSSSWLMEEKDTYESTLDFF